ncbi:hypothetical protein MTsPCn3_01230 [Erythrobacter sp. MTPC3]
MERQKSSLAARGITDDRDRLISADEALAQLQEDCGGTVPGALAVPELRAIVRQGREMGLKVAREFSAFDGADIVSGFVRVHPIDSDAGGGCELLVDNWQRTPSEQASTKELAERLDSIDRAAAEITARLDADQRVQLLSAVAPDAQQLEKDVAASASKNWIDFVTLRDVAHQQPLHWRLLDGVHCTVPGSDRQWRVRLLPMGSQSREPVGFELLLVADEPLLTPIAQQGDAEEAGYSRLMGSTLTPVLRQPVARIIANAETIRAKLAGPLRSEYSDYAGNIAAAGQHLSAMLDDLVDLDVVESPDFTTASEKVDLGDAARKAAGILGVRAQARSIALDLPGEGEAIFARAEVRRVLQILINLIGNAIAYSPEGSTVSVAVHQQGDGQVALSVADEGAGIDPDQASRIFEKFERLGRDSAGGTDTGSGLGLYISRKLARVMKGDLAVDLPISGNGDAGARFVLTLPEFGE